MKPRRTSTVTVLILLLLLTAASATAQGIEESVRRLTDQLVQSLQGTPDSKIAVIEFTDLSGQTLLAGRLIAEEITTALFQSGRSGVKLIERSKLDAVIQEQKRGAQGLLDSEDVQAFGKALGVDGVLTGTIAKLGSSLRVNARLIAVPSAKILATASIHLNKDVIPPELLMPIDSAATPAGSSGEQRHAVAFKPRTQDQKGITYELLRCFRTSRDISCELLVTNNGADRSLLVRGNYGGNSTYLYDQRGHTFTASVVRLADAENGGRVDKRLLADIPTALSFKFEGMPAAIEFIKVLSIYTGDGRVEFRDVHFASLP